MKTIALTAAMLFVSALSFAQETYSVKVVVNGFVKREGKVHAIISNDAEKFPAAAGLKTASTDITPEGEVTLSFHDIPEGKYAIFLYHDLNGNGQIDMNGGIPSEPFGFSNISMLMGPPDFDECAFTLNENKILTIGMFFF